MDRGQPSEDSWDQNDARLVLHDGVALTHRSGAAGLAPGEGRRLLWGIAIAAVWLREPLHAGQLWGGSAIVAGLILGLSRQIKNSEAKAPLPGVPSRHDLGAVEL